MNYTQVMNYAQVRMTLIFDEWARRYAESPQEFSEILDEDGKPIEGWGAAATIYFWRLAEELEAEGKLPLPPERYQ